MSEIDKILNQEPEREYHFLKDNNRGALKKQKLFFVDVFLTRDISKSYWLYYKIPKSDTTSRKFYMIKKSLTQKTFVKHLVMNDLLDEFKKICEENKYESIWEAIAEQKELLQLDDDTHGLKMIVHETNSKLRLNKGGLLRFSSIKEDVKIDNYNKLSIIRDRVSPSVAAQDKYDNNSAKCIEILRKMIADETNIEEEFVQLFLLFNNYIMIMDNNSAPIITELQKGFLELVNNSSGIEHLQILLEALKNNKK